MRPKKRLTRTMFPMRMQVIISREQKMGWTVFQYLVRLAYYI